MPPSPAPAPAPGGSGDPLLNLATSVLRGQGGFLIPHLVINGDNKALCEQAVGRWRSIVPWIQRRTDVPSLLLSLHKHYGFRWLPEVGVSLSWRPRRFNADADALAKGALFENRVFSRWSPLAFTLFLRSLPPPSSSSSPRHLPPRHNVLRACGARSTAHLHLIVVELMGASFSSALVAFLIDFMRRLAWTVTLQMHIVLRKLDSYGYCMHSSILPW